MGTQYTDPSSGIQSVVQGCPTWIDLTYVDPVTQDVVPYVDADGVAWAGGYTTNPTFNFASWQNASGINTLTYSLWQ